MFFVVTPILPEIHPKSGWCLIVPLIDNFMDISFYPFVYLPPTSSAYSASLLDWPTEKYE